MSDSSKAQQEFLNRLSEIMEANLENEQFGVSEMAGEMGMSRSNLHRKIGEALNISASQYIRQVRLKKAKELLQETSFTVSEISYKVGFGSTSYFIKCFREQFGYTPGESENHEKVNALPLKHKAWLKPVKFDKSDFIVWSIVFILLTNVFFIIFWPKINSPKKQGKTIAILYFEDLSPSAEKSYIINGLREDILDNLFSVKDIEVVPDAIMDQYKNSGLSALEIAKKTKADFILTAKGETSNENTTVWFELLETKSGKQRWRKNKNLSLSNYFELRKDVAYALVNELKANLSLEEIEEIEKIPTNNMAAYNKFLLGEEYLNLKGLNASIGNSEQMALEQKAKLNFEEAIQLDSTFAEAYVRLGHIYMTKSFVPTISLSEQYMDSGLVMAQKAIHYDEKNGWAYDLLKNYYIHRGDFTKANEYADKSEKLSKENIPEWEKYRLNFWNARAMHDHHHHAIENFYRYKKTKPQEIKIVPNTLQALILNLDAIGFPEVSQKVALEILNFDNDSAYFFRRLWRSELHSGNFDASRRYVIKFNSFSSNKNAYLLYVLIQFHFYSKDYNKAINYFNEILQFFDESEFPYQFFYEAGYIYLVQGENEKAKSIFNKSILKNQKEIELNRRVAQIYETHFSLACIYSTLNQKDKAIEYLVQLKKRNYIDVWLVTRLKYSPMLDNIRNEPEFAEVLKDVETKYQKEHEKVGKLLRELEVIE